MINVTNPNDGYWDGKLNCEKIIEGEEPKEELVYV